MSRCTNLRSGDFGIVASSFMDFMNELSEDGRLSELEKYIWDSADINRWNLEKAKIVFEVLKLRNRDEAKNILSYMEHLEYGWQGSTYHLRNHCLCGDRNNHCKRNHKIDNTEEATSDAFEVIEYIFLHKNYGGITSYLFGYCLAALFSSRLKMDNLRVPYFLQIACERNSNIYRLIHEIVDICDVNTDLIEHCNMDIDYGYCDYEYVTVFPVQSTDKTLEDLVYNRDVPVIIDGYENEKFYGALLRETANIPGKMRTFDIKDRFNILPIFICPVIRSQYKNVLSIDLTGLDIDDECLEIIRENKQRLASWALELVKCSKDYFFQRNTKEDVMFRRTDEERPFFDDINKHINRIRKEYRHYTELTSKDVANIGFLTYFLSRYMEVFKKSIKLYYGTKFTYRTNFEAHNPSKLITGIVNCSTDILFKFHNTYSPTLPLTVSIVTNDPNLNSTKTKQARKKGEKYAKDIVKYYQSYGVSLRIMPEAEFKDDRYIFNIKLMPGTDGNLISRYSDEIRRLLELGFFAVDRSHSSIKIIASEKPLEECSLLKILKSSNFKESKMKIPYAVGYDMMGEMVIADIADFPHLLIGGTSGSGKSSALHSLLMSIVCKQRADKVKLLLLDFGASGLKMFENTPHMVAPTITASEIEKGRVYIFALIALMERRLAELEFIDERKRDKELDLWPAIICVIDEFPTFIRKLTAGKVNKMSHMLLTDLLERARKVKIHLILAAQDSTKGNIAIKMTNIDAAIAFKCTNRYDSQAILHAPDAINLSGKGSMYFRCYQHEGLKRMQGSFMKPIEIIDMLDNMNFDSNDIEGQWNEVFETKLLPKFIDVEPESVSSSSEDTHVEMLVKISMWALGQDKISNKQIKDHFEMGYDRANLFLSELESFGLITKAKKGTKLPRTVIPKKIEDIPISTVEFLEKHGYNETNIKNALYRRKDTTKI